MTYSIVAREPLTGRLGVAVQSCVFAVGTRVPFARPGVGAVAVQAASEITWGPLALDMLASGMSAADVIGALVDLDASRAPSSPSSTQTVPSPPSRLRWPAPKPGTPPPTASPAKRT